MLLTQRFDRRWEMFCAAASRILACCARYVNMRKARKSGNQGVDDVNSRRDFLKSCGALFVGFSAASLAGSLANGQGEFGTHLSQIDPAKLDSWLAVGADGSITAYTGKCDFGQGIFTAQTQLI